MHSWPILYSMASLYHDLTSKGSPALFTLAFMCWLILLSVDVFQKVQVFHASASVYPLVAMRIQAVEPRAYLSDLHVINLDLGSSRH